MIYIYIYILYVAYIYIHTLHVYIYIKYIYKFGGSKHQNHFWWMFLPSRSVAALGGHEPHELLRPHQGTAVRLLRLPVLLHGALIIGRSLVGLICPEWVLLDFFFRRKMKLGFNTCILLWKVGIPRSFVFLMGVLEHLAGDSLTQVLDP